MKEDFDFEEYNNSIHRDGRILMTIALALLIAVPFIIALITGAHINWKDFWPALIKVLIIYVPSSAAEFLIYVPLLGAGACYLAFITGNLTNLKIPCAFNAREIAGAEAGTPENEIISTLSVATSALVTMVVIFIGVLLLIPLTPLLNNPVIKPAFDNVLPALFGALGMQYYMKSLKLSVLPLLLMSVLCILIPSLIAQTSTMIIVIGAFSIALSYLMYRKNWL
ncbi:MAG: hypothetical protein IAA72_09245 [Spirochaetes bacterium]|uniref:Uncharacterized protein n=1 Tax=Candidatus Ornithospirochaeta stercoravium TaxID=2840897 RepID=A0A9D9NDX9_9SPIO|nr:hypothetical protein [Candidatus Ornithospirochaeta stercoravium]